MKGHGISPTGLRLIGGELNNWLLTRAILGHFRIKTNLGERERDRQTDRQTDRLRQRHRERERERENHM